MAKQTQEVITPSDLDGLPDGSTYKRMSATEQTKLGTVEDSATTDQTGAEIKTAYEAEASAYTDTKDTKLTGIEDSATVDQTGAEIQTAVEVFLLKPGDEYLSGIGEAAIDGNEVSINVSGEYINRRGLYKIYFVCTLSYGERTHGIQFEVRDNPELNR